MAEAQEKTAADDELIRRFKDQGDLEAYSAIFNRYRRDVFRLGYGFFHNREDAMEIVQETFIRIFERIDRFTMRSGFKGWVFRIASNVCVDMYRRRTRRRTKQRDLYEMQPVTDKNGPDEAAGAEQEQRLLRLAIAQLPDRQKSIVVMRHFGHMKFREIAAALRLSVGTVKSLHHRAFHRLRDEVLLKSEVS